MLFTSEWNNETWNTTSLKFVYNGVTKSGSLPKIEFLLLCTYRKSRIVVTFEMDKKWATFHFFIFFINFLCPKTLKSKLDLQQTWYSPMICALSSAFQNCYRNWLNRLTDFEMAENVRRWKVVFLPCRFGDHHFGDFAINNQLNWISKKVLKSWAQGADHRWISSLMEV